MKTLAQSPTDPQFVQNPYPFYASARDKGPLHHWQEYGMQAAFTYDAVHSLLRDKRFGREIPEEFATPGPAHLAPFLAVEAHSMLDAEPPRHTRLRKLVLRAFTSRQIEALRPQITALCHQLIDTFPQDEFDLLPAYCTQLPVHIIARFLGVPDTLTEQYLVWSHAMVAMYQAGRTRQTEDRAATAAAEFSAFLREYIDQRRSNPQDDLITRLIAAEDAEGGLSTDELVTTCILLLNAGHEATVHALGNGVKTLLEHGFGSASLTPDRIDGTIEEILRFDPPLHMFTRYAYESVSVFGHRFQRGEQVALLLASANRDSALWPEPDQFKPDRSIRTNTSFGAGLHFCVGAPLARLELRLALPILFERCPDLRLAHPPEYADTYHFHSLKRLMVRH